MNDTTSEAKAKRSRSRAVAASVAAICALTAAVPATSSAAAKRDRDRDGLSNRAERRIGTSPKRADTDRDRLKDGREVRLGSNPLRADTDGDGTPDGQEVSDGTDPCTDENEVEGVLSAVGESSVTIIDGDGVETVVAIDGATELVAPDRDASGDVTLADFQVGDRVEAHMSPDGSVATALKVEGEGEHGDEGEENEVKGSLTAIGEASVTITGRDGVATEVAIDSNTEFRAPSRERDGEVTLADFQIGDRVKAELSADGSVATELKRLPATAQGHGRGKGHGRGQGRGRGQD